jgi:hypothetical protein
MEETGRFVVAYTLAEFALTGSLTLIATVLPYVFHSLASDQRHASQDWFEMTSEMGLVVLTLGLGITWLGSEFIIRLFTPGKDAFLGAAVFSLLVPSIVARYLAIAYTQPVLAQGQTATVGLAYGGSVVLTGALVSVAAFAWDARGVAASMLAMPLAVLLVLRLHSRRSRFRRAAVGWAAFASIAMASSAIVSMTFTLKLFLLVLVLVSVPRQAIRAAWRMARQPPPTEHPVSLDMEPE